jgi:hypothetical protein
MSGLPTDSRGGFPPWSVPGCSGNEQLKSAPDFSVQDASAALPQNCQTTKWILLNDPFGVNVTLVISCSGL